ncbi:TPA: hypothetical protein RQN06_000757 [Aeromonas veronii]|nr:hypothetical protein [Aeromonas veronii]
MKKERGQRLPPNQSTPLRGEEKAQNLIGFGRVVVCTHFKGLSREHESTGALSLILYLNSWESNSAQYLKRLFYYHWNMLLLALTISFNDLSCIFLIH